MADILLSNGQKALLDDEDLSKAVGCNWHRHRVGVCTWKRTKSGNPIIMLHRVVLGPKRDEIVKFKNGDKLDNRKSNLFTISRRGTVWNLPAIHCACGCGKKIEAYTANGTARRFINGHNARKYFGPDGRKQAQKNWRLKNPVTVARLKKAHYRRRKLKAMAVLGNRCVDCGVGYGGKNAAIFEFHHLNPEKKDSGITRMLTTFKWKTVLDELKKCRLLCANCHNLRHGGGW